MTTDEEGPSVADRFNRSHAARLKSATMERLWRAAYGDDYPEEVNPSAFYSRTTLRRVLDALRLGQGKTVADLGCGHGGAGIWIARETGANLIGVDLSAAGVALAGERAASLGLGDRAHFYARDMTATGLPEGSCDAAISLDVLVFVPDKAAAVREVARILCPSGRFAFTTWEQPGFSERLKAAQLTDYRPLLAEKGFTVETYMEPANWRRQQRALLDGIVAAESQLNEEMDATAAGRLIAMARGMLSEMGLRRYVFVVARRR